VKTKTAYRPKNIPVETPAPSVPVDDERIQPSATTSIEFTNNKTDPAVAVVSADEYPQPDEATLALQKQLADLRKSEQMQREFATHVAVQRAAQAAPAPTLPAEPEDRIALWRQQGLTPGDADFLAAHLELAAEPDLTRLASDEAAQHHERDTDAHRAATLEAFHRLQGQQAQTRTATDPAGFFEPPEPARSPAAPDRAALYSAPVSRTASPGSYREPSPRSVKLSPAEQQIAAASGISDIEYAKNKMRMLRERAAGERD
jgi:hypothetical protein